MDIVLALGGGGVRGYAHLGVIKALMQSRFRIRAVAGTSAGAIVGALFAAGYELNEIKDKLDKIDFSQVFKRHSEDPPSFMGLAGVEKFLQEMLGERRFSDLEIPFAVNSVDMHSCRLLSIREGSVVDAVLASIAIPGFFPPRQINGCYLVDGSILEPVPVRPARALAPGLPVVAVVLSPVLESLGAYNEESSLIGSLPFLHHILHHSRLAQSVHVFLQAVDMGSVLLADMIMERDRPEIIIRPNVFRIGLLDRVNGDDLVAAGENAAIEQLDELRQAVSWRGKLRGRLNRLIHR